jgi:hypothetical protein
MGQQLQCRPKSCELKVLEYPQTLSYWKDIEKSLQVAKNKTGVLGSRRVSATSLASARFSGLKTLREHLNPTIVDNYSIRRTSSFNIQNNGAEQRCCKEIIESWKVMATRYPQTKTAIWKLPCCSCSIKAIGESFDSSVGQEPANVVGEQAQRKGVYKEPISYLKLSLLR